MTITPTTDLAPFIGVTTNVTFVLDGNPFHNGVQHATVVIRDVHHGATSSGRYGLDHGVYGCADYFAPDGRRIYSSYFYWPYDGLKVEAA